MLDSNYTMVDIAKFVNDYKEVIRSQQPKAWMFKIPIIGIELQSKVFFENAKIDFFENTYNKFANATINEQQEFIMKMTPVLDDFYSHLENYKDGDKKTLRR